ncbi:hypothetical protein GCM10027403_13150 [Arthrobacter tecti]
MSVTARTPGAAFERLVEVIGLLRERCPWMGELTHESLAEYLVEECYELLEVIEGPANPDELRAELGDVLLQVVLHARLQEERGSFRITDVVEGLTAKMIRRNSHVFTAEGELKPDSGATIQEIEAQWHRRKSAEKPESTTPFDSLPAHLPALALAAKSVTRARRDSGHSGPPATARSGPTSEEELGSVLLDLVHGAVDSGLDPERALRLAVRRYQEEYADAALGRESGSVTDAR